ncbi:hypothetical protein BCR37DRAFT_192881 [Protomyces lactucae-debilis]|uniref:Uncharacterized protein n=1 Tax=Protomyces lactucae-debilis TaxID=2754530 RepID=A0A1Y2EU38_PROLT|nr:uncharacterized protein BCR37DRAFT_192881 [Protomyces lactucae-debilis]ORY75082.1 hypothetical protein BCR37DRAFT_192881 [Protomyces lactucae-debilis]
MVQVDKTSVLLGVAMALFVWPTQSMAQASGPAWCDVFPVPYPFKGVVGKGSLNSNAEILNLKDCYAVRNGRLVSCNTVINLPKTEACWVATYNDELRTRIPSNALSDSRAGAEFSSIVAISSCHGHLCITGFRKTSSSRKEWSPMVRLA